MQSGLSQSLDYVLEFIDTGLVNRPLLLAFKTQFFDFTVFSLSQSLDLDLELADSVLQMLVEVRDGILVSFLLSYCCFTEGLPVFVVLPFLLVELTMELS